MKNSDKKYKKTPEQKRLEEEERDEKLPYNPEITEHDLDILSQDNIHGDGGDDQQLKDRVEEVDFAGEDLDIPGRESAREWDKIGLPDEENKLYSQGGERKDDLERDDSGL